MKDNNMLSLRERLMGLPTEELDTMMQAELRKETPDENAVKLILGILEEREKDIPVEMDERTEAAWEKYQERMAKEPIRPKRSRRWIQVCVTASAAVLALALLVVVPQRAEALEFIREVISGWRDDILEFFSPGETVSEVERTFETDHEGMQLIYDTAVEMGVEDPLIPREFESGYEIKSCEILSTPTKSFVNIVLFDGTKEAVFNIYIFQYETAHGYYAEDEYYTQFEREGIVFEISRNKDKWISVWKKDGVEYFLTIDCQEDKLQNLLESIYVTEE